MIQVRRASERGQADHGWLKSQHTFSFASYFDPSHMGFGPLRVINEDRVSGGAGFGLHPHRDMEILSYVISGGLKHADSMGNGEVVQPGEIQLMSAGTGVRHSEFNASETKPVHFLQIWIEPAQKGTAPRYDQRAFSADDRRNQWLLLVAPQGEAADVAKIGQDVRIFTTALEAGEALSYEPAAGRKVWVQMIDGGVTLRSDGEEKATVVAGDGVAIEAESVVQFASTADAELLLFDLPA